ncbi:hypothetical protein AB0J83_39710 [Actinoplanes sp. NPDC049596]|uniref:hypothetical protein n=1 Tax=unclassified Actinoplanes TaxID=2626549 RepID=UPI00341ED2B5
MRARRRQILVSLVAAVTVALTGVFAPSPDPALAVTCPGSTTWDDFLKRCV